MSDIPDKCQFCGADYHGEGKTDKWEWTQYKCSTEFENGEWLQDDDCRIAQLDNTITALRTELAEAKHTIARVSFYAGQSTGEIRMLKQRVAELEAGIAKILPDFNCRMFTPYHKLLSALLPPDRITHIPGKEDDDGEMH